MNQLSKFFATLLLKVILFLLIFGGSSVNAQSRSTSISISDNGKTSISVKNGFGNNFHVEFRGDITLSDDDMDVVAISRGGFMEIKKSAFGNRRRILIESNNSGQLIKKYYVGSSERNFDSEGRKWMAEILLEVVRTSTLGSEQRVDRIYRKGGAYGVLKEVGFIGGNHVKSRYIKLLLEKDLKNADLISVLKVVGDDIDSDHHRADILKANITKFLSTEASITAFIEAASEIDSDHHKAEVLKRLVKNGAIKENQLNALFVIARDIDSDYHKSSVLTTVLRSSSLNNSNLKLLLSTAKEIDSDHHKSQVFQTALNTEGVTDDTFHTLLNVLESMDSDSHLDNVLSKVLRKKLSPSSLSHALKQVGNMDSDSHKANVLKIAVRKELNSENIDALINVLDHMGSDHHRADVFKQMARNTYSDEQLSKIFTSIKNINSDYHKAESLIAFSRTASKYGQQTKEAYRSACKSISSDSHYRRASNAIE
ncbi:hypothetical protein [Flagellimonas pacifica]|uniref:Uncharacterized protein n=1 Tax=Flagellimonas pacifica TaxID=1247520 RepID=A0A285MS09_9FLAO|nr:hypothetical protein [Allomuricauda parva]SNY99989.1 hypothetical protein SAMN06265377_1806 [Allomuricauda parva]